MFKNKKRVYLLLAVIMVIMVIIEVLFAHPHYHMIWNRVPGFDLLIGFAGAWALILLAKIAMATLLQSDEDYYESSGKDGGGNAQ